MIDEDVFREAVIKAYRDGVVDGSINSLKVENAEDYYLRLYGNGGLLKLNNCVNNEEGD